MKLKVLHIIFCAILVASSAQAGTAKLINEYACKGLDEENYNETNGIIKLYGIRTNGPDTKNGQLACAKVVTIILQKAGVVEEIALGVRHVEKVIEKWVGISQHFYGTFRTFSFSIERIRRHPIELSVGPVG
jgi:CRISPR/Cas system-associated protein Csm6